MGYEETNPIDIKISKVQKLIQEFFPNIRNEEIVFFYHGTYNTFIVKDTFIFRFPDKSLYNDKGYRLIQREIKVLDTIRNLLSFQIPKPLYVSSDPNNPFVGYEKIPGISLSRCLNNASHSEKKNIANEIGKFLSEYHSRAVYEVFKQNFYPSQELSSEHHKKIWSDYREKMERIVFPLVGKKSTLWLTNLFDNFLANKENFTYSLTATHGDFDTSNILVNPESFQITGIIDFEDANIADPAYDLCFIEEGKDFSDAIFENYTGIIDPTMKDRIKFYYCRAGTIYIITGVEWNNPRMIEYGKKLQEKRMKEFPA
ncbi:MAG: phosphotransferase [Candidatus Heimdallarchaeota archaeon]|nr:phosphotransferase [Candidatus Heimdallarchaeota archaeon]